MEYIVGYQEYNGEFHVFVPDFPDCELLLKSKHDMEDKIISFYNYLKDCLETLNLTPPVQQEDKSIYKNNKQYQDYKWFTITIGG